MISLFSVEFTESAEKQFSKLSLQVQERIIAVIERIRTRPEENIVKLVGMLAYKFRISDYRVICDLDYARNIISVLKVGHRKNIYYG